MAYKPKPQTVVILDDDGGNATILEMLLSMGTTSIPLVYHSAREMFACLEELKQSYPALFLVDYLLPRTDGICVCEQLRQIEEFKDVPTVLVSASTAQSLTNDAEQRGFMLIHKPYDVDELLEVVRQQVAHQEESVSLQREEREAR